MYRFAAHWLQTISSFDIQSVDPSEVLAASHPRLQLALRESLLLQVSSYPDALLVGFPSTCEEFPVFQFDLAARTGSLVNGIVRPVGGSDAVRPNRPRWKNLQAAKSIPPLPLMMVHLGRSLPLRPTSFAGAGHCLEVYDAETGEMFLRKFPPRSFGFFCGDDLPSRRWVVYAGFKEFCVYDLQNELQTVGEMKHSGNISSVRCQDKMGLFATANSSTLRMWDVRSVGTGRNILPVMEVPFGGDSVLSGVMQEDSPYLVSYSSGWSQFVCEVRDFRKMDETVCVFSKEFGISDFASSFGPQSRQILVTADDSSLVLLRMMDGKVLLKHKFEHSSEVLTGLLSCAGDLVSYHEVVEERLAFVLLSGKSQLLMTPRSFVVWTCLLVRIISS